MESYEEHVFLSVPKQSTNELSGSDALRATEKEKEAGPFAVAIMAQSDRKAWKSTDPSLQETRRAEHVSCTLNSQSTTQRTRVCCT